MWPKSDHAFMNQNSANYNPDTAHKALETVSAFFKSTLI